MESVLIFKVNQLGDSVVGLPLVEAAVNRVGAEHVSIATTPVAADLYKNLIPAENTFIMPRDDFNGSWKSPGLLFSVLRWVRQRKPEGILIPTDQGAVARLVSRLSGANLIVEMVNSHIDFPPVGAFSCRLDPKLTMHENDWLLFRNFAKCAGWPEVPEKPQHPGRAMGAARWSPNADGPILIHCGSSREATRWDIGRFFELARQFAERGHKVLWMKEGDATPPEHPQIEILERRPLMEFARIASSCSLFIGNNSGPMHLCDTAGVPMVILCGPVGPEWDPYWSKHTALVREKDLECQPCEGWSGRIWECPRSEEPFACMTRPDANRILNHALTIMKKAKEEGTIHDQ